VTDFSELREDVIEHIKDNMSVVAGGADGEEFGELAELLSAQFQALGICNLLIALDAEGLSRNLCQSAFARRFFLRKSLERVESRNPFWALSRTQALFDAIAAGADGVARDIAGLSPTSWDRDGEYEDDFYYFMFVHDLVRRNWLLDAIAAQRLLERFEQTLVRATDPRYRLCAATLGRNPLEFWPAFEDYLHERQMEVQKPPISDDAWLEPPRHVWVEGLAWLRIAEQLGLSSPQPEYALLPGPARLPLLNLLPNDLFRALEQRAGL
jgi:Immunity protein 49